MNIKILVGYHKPDFLIKNDIYIPIHLGRSLKNEELKDYSIGENCNDFMLKNMIGDDIGDNISHLNKYFNELTGIYWAWKNYDKLGNPDYIGYVHYRRFLLFDQNNVSYPKAPNNYDLVCNFANEIFLNSIEPRDYVQQYDMIIPKPLESTLVNCDFKDLRELNLSYNFSDYGLKLLEKIILSSEYRNLYSDIVKEFYKRTSYYPANIFIMKKELFFDFCEFRFNIAFKMFEIMEKRLINSSIHGSREMGWALEHLMSFYVAFLKNKNYKIKELPIVILKNTQVDILKKKYLVSDKDIVIVFCVDESSFPLLSVNINSILENATFLEKYTISILHLNINRDRLDSLLKNFEDKISIEFHNIQYIYDEFFGLKFRISFFEYIKFWIPEIFSNYKQVFYLDINVLILNDLLNLGKIYSKNPLYGIQDISLSVDFYKNICFSKDINLENLEEY
ncbi:TPA: DUF4422 domain-containing protein, partial [Campylobacter jejuni]|nr:DUF4422 domain-containing protein [Campylobacter jejuni]